MYIAVGQGHTTPQDIKFWCQYKPHVTLVICYKFQRNLLKSFFFIQFFSWFYLYMYTAPGMGLTTPWGRNFDVNRNILSLWSFFASFKKNLFEVWFYTIFFMILYMYIVPGQGQTAPRKSFDVNRNVLSLHSFGVSLKKNVFEVWFYTIFFMIWHMYIALGAGADSPQGTKFWCQQKDFITLPTCCKFQRNLFEVWFYTIFFMI